MKKYIISIVIINNLFFIQKNYTQTVHSKKYDNFNRLIESSDGTNTIVYTYDELGNRTQESITVTLSVSEEQIVGLKLYPNPTPDKVFITAKTIIDKVIVSDMSGKVIGEYKNNQNTISVDISKLPVGLYNLVIYSERKKQGVKVVKR
ncbi:T9SS type A sorting domain-containing protein [Tenacibaculum xiamenense]|uniref:T9SS type A sorting domain-containing protein n=1 Tax=Tenacibaculum xiamenense TaxID=1261553 RepID=UPI00389668A6